MTVFATMRRAAVLGGVAFAAIGFSTAAFAQKTKLTVYTAIENEQLEPFKKAFDADNPTIEIAWVRFDRRRDRKSTRLNSSHSGESRMPSSA